MTLLATSFVVIGGAVTCAFIGTLSGESPLRLATMTGTCFGGIAFFLWLLREKQPGNAAADRWSWLARDDRQRVEYRAAPRVPRHERPKAPNSPPTADSVRALTGGLDTWVPSKGRTPRKDADSSLTGGDDE